MRPANCIIIQIAFNKKSENDLWKIFSIPPGQLNPNEFGIYLTIEGKMDLLALK